MSIRQTGAFSYIPLLPLRKSRSAEDFKAFDSEDSDENTSLPTHQDVFQMEEEEASPSTSKPQSALPLRQGKSLPHSSSVESFFTTEEFAAPISSKTGIPIPQKLKKDKLGEDTWSDKLPTWTEFTERLKHKPRVEVGAPKYWIARKKQLKQEFEKRELLADLELLKLLQQQDAEDQAKKAIEGSDGTSQTKFNP